MFGIMSTVNCLTMAILLLAGALITGCSKKEEHDRVEYIKADGKKTTDVKSIGDGAAAYQVIGGRAVVPAKAEKLHRQARAKGNPETMRLHWAS
ncbi:MAG: hypothetical protein U1F77_00180 [Kiritimatiellia bacterium]